MEKTDRVKCLDRAIANGAAINDSLFCSLMADYPYFLPAMVMRMQDGSLTDSQRQQLLAGAATTIGNREDLFYLVGNDGSAIRIHNTETDNKTKSTMDTISHFLDTFGNNDDAETRALEQRIFNPTPDYAQLLAKEEEKSEPEENGEESEHDRLINKFITRSRQQSGRFPSTADNDADRQADEVAEEVARAPKPTAPVADDDPSLLSESLAKIYIRQHKFAKALEIIQSLSLNYSEKSIYFADQIRFLKKLPKDILWDVIGDNVLNRISQGFGKQNNDTCITVKDIKRILTGKATKWSDIVKGSKSGLFLLFPCHSNPCEPILHGASSKPALLFFPYL